MLQGVTDTKRIICTRTTEERVRELRKSGCSEGTVNCYKKISNMIENCIRVCNISKNEGEQASQSL